MDDPKVQLQQSLKEAIVSKDNLRRDVIRMALNAIKQVEIDEQKTLTPEEALTILQREVKRRRDSIAEAESLGRGDIAADEAAQLAILETFLPAQLSREEIETLAREAIAESSAASPKEMGKVMAVLMPKVKGKADGKLVNDVVRSLLNG